MKDMAISKMLQEAAEDKDVVSIKMTLYRVASRVRSLHLDRGSRKWKRCHDPCRIKG